MKRLAQSIFFMLFPLLLWGQADRWWMQYQYTGNPDIEAASIWANGSYEIASNRLHNELLGAFTGTQAVTGAQSEYLIDAASNSRTHLGADIQAGAWFRSFGSSRLRFHAGAGVAEQFFGSFSTGLAQLVLNGNGKHEDNALELGPSWMRYVSQQHVGIGLELESDRLIIGGMVKLLKVSRWQSINLLSGSLYTAPYGTSIEADLTATHQFTSTAQAKTGAWYGTGFTTDFFLINRPAPGEMMISVQIKDLGFMQFSGIHQADYLIDSTFRGVEASNILSEGLSLQTERGIDSISSFLDPVFGNDPSLAFYPGFLQFDVVKPIGSRMSLALELRQLFLSIPPRIRAGWRISLGEYFAVEPYALTGGFTRFDTGLTASLRLGKTLNIWLNYGLLESQLTPKRTVSQHIVANFHVTF